MNVKFKSSSLALIVFLLALAFIYIPNQENEAKVQIPKIGFSECKTQSGFSVLKPTLEELTKSESIYLLFDDDKTTKIASLKLKEMRVLGYGFEANGINSNLSGTIYINLTKNTENKESVYVLTRDLNNAPEVTEQCTFKKGEKYFVTHQDVNLGPWDVKYERGYSRKFRNLTINKGNYMVGFQSILLDENNRVMSAQNHGFEEVDGGYIIEGTPTERSELNPN